jgi:hypothetical protein
MCTHYFCNIDESFQVALKGKKILIEGCSKSSKEKELEARVEQVLLEAVTRKMK